MAYDEYITFDQERELDAIGQQQAEDAAEREYIRNENNTAYIDLMDECTNTDDLNMLFDMLYTERDYSDPGQDAVVRFYFHKHVEITGYLF